MKRKRATAEQIAEARWLAGLGVPIAKIARDRGVWPCTVRGWVDEQYREERAAYIRANWRTICLTHEVYQQVAAEAERRGVPVGRLAEELLLQGLKEAGA